MRAHLENIINPIIIVQEQWTPIRPELAGTVGMENLFYERRLQDGLPKNLPQMEAERTDDCWLKTYKEKNKIHVSFKIKNKMSKWLIYI